MIVLLAVGVRRLSIPFPRHQDREQQPVRPSQHQPQGVQEGPEAGKKRSKSVRKAMLYKMFLDERGSSIGWGACRTGVEGSGRFELGGGEEHAGRPDQPG